MNLNADIVGYNAGLETAQRELAESICSVIADGLPSAAGKVQTVSGAGTSNPMEL
jgi:hypothetical protein